jgi:hypothetical protein
MSVYIRLLMFKKQTATVITCLFNHGHTFSNDDMQ